MKQEEWESGTGQRMLVHHRSVCRGEPCPIHNPTAHPMVTFPTHWRSDRTIMERICPHGIGHPDPDDHKVRLGIDPGDHGCDGCCAGAYDGYPPLKKEDAGDFEEPWSPTIMGFIRSLYQFLK